MSFHRGQLGVFELIGNKLRLQVLEGESAQDKSFGNGTVDSYIILEEPNNLSQVVLAIVDNRLTSYIVSRCGADWVQELNEDRVSIKQEVQQ